MSSCHPKLRVLITSDFPHTFCVRSGRSEMGAWVLRIGRKTKCPLVSVRCSCPNMTLQFYIHITQCIHSFTQHKQQQDVVHSIEHSSNRSNYDRACIGHSLFDFCVRDQHNLCALLSTNSISNLQRSRGDYYDINALTINRQYSPYRHWWNKAHSVGSLQATGSLLAKLSLVPFSFISLL